jgi:hypothetical protein
MPPPVLVEQVDKPDDESRSELHRPIRALLRDVVASGDGESSARESLATQVSGKMVFSDAWRQRVQSSLIGAIPREDDAPPHSVADTTATAADSTAPGASQCG